MPNKAPNRPLSDDELGLKLVEFLLPLTEKSPLKEELAQSKAVTVELDESGVPIVRAGDESASTKVKNLLFPLAKQFPLNEALERWQCVGFWLDEDGRPGVGYTEMKSLTERPRRFKVSRYDH